MKLRFFRSAAAFRAWLEEHHAARSELLVGFYKKESGRGGLTYQEALDEALCFGWIDGVRRRHDAASYTIRFTPRRPRSIWSQVNIRRVEELRASGRMAPAGLAAFEARDEAKSLQYSYENRSRGLDEALIGEFRKNARAWKFFTAQPPGYQRVASWWVISAVKDETRRRRLATLMKYSAAAERLPMLKPPAR